MVTRAKTVFEIFRDENRNASRPFHYFSNQWIRRILHTITDTAGFSRHKNDNLLNNQPCNSARA